VFWKSFLCKEVMFLLPPEPMFSTQQRFQSSEQTIMAVELYSCAQQHTVAAAPSAPSPALAHVSPRSQDAAACAPAPAAA